MFEVKTVAVNKTSLEFDSEFEPKLVPAYLGLAKTMAKKGVNPINKKWIFKNESFKNLMEMSMEGLRNFVEEEQKLKEDIEHLEIIEELSFEKGYIKVHKDVPNEILIDTFRAIPTFWHLMIIKGDKTWQNISQFAVEYFASQTPDQLKELTKEYWEEGGR